MSNISDMEIRHLRRDIMTALELAIAGQAPWNLVEKLAMSAGLLEALSELPGHTLIPETMEKARVTLQTWKSWNKEHKGVSA